MKVVNKNRETNIELLRILALLGVIVLHYNGYVGHALELVAPRSMNYYVLSFLECVCACAVDLFVLISGYFLSQKDYTGWKKPVKLILEVILIKEVFYFVQVYKGEMDLNLHHLFGNALPNNYFAIYYCVLYMLAPYLNRVIRNANEKEQRRFLGLILLFFSICPTI